MKNAKKNSLIAPAIALAIMVVIAALIVVRDPDSGNKPITSAGSQSVQPITTMQLDAAAKATMQEIENKYSDYTGNDYDRYFIANMIEHHKGAVEMAKLAQANASHQELKAMASDIISNQNKEINDMLAWQKSWGYPSSTGDMMIDHSGMNMADDMASMASQLKTLRGDAFDKEFTRLMIEHHQSAIAMARPGASNALHSEVKDLTQAIINDQTKEVIRMQQWWRDWGY